jgi:SAM-dependent methyltransferase
MTPQPADSRTFSSHRLSRLSEIEGWHFWFAGRRALIDRLVERHVPRTAVVLDLGCGTGSTVANLARRGNTAIGMDMRPEGLLAVRASGSGASLVRGDAEALPFASRSVDAVILLDVLEHVDDEALLPELREILRPGGRLVMTVPALPSLWSYRDEDAGHRRRYTRSSLVDSLRFSGFDVLEVRYYQFLLLPLLALARIAGRMRRVGRRVRDFEEMRIPVLNSLMSVINRAEVKLSDLIPMPVGSSLAAVCVRR